MGLGQKGRVGRGAFISFFDLASHGLAFQRDAFMCYLYNYRNIKNEMLQKITAKINVDH